MKKVELRDKNLKSYTVELDTNAELGKGNYGAVYKGYNPKTKLHSAVKKMTEKVTRRQLRIEREA